MWHPLSPWNLPCVSSFIENCLIVNHGWFSESSHVRIFFLGGFPCVYLVIIVTKLLSHQLTTHHNCPYSARVESLLLCAIHWTMWGLCVVSNSWSQVFLLMYAWFIGDWESHANVLWHHHGYSGTIYIVQPGGGKVMYCMYVGFIST